MAPRPVSSDALDEGRSSRCDGAEYMDVCHDVVAAALLLFCSLLHLLLVEREMRTHLLDSLVGDRESELLLRNGEVQPELAPRTKAGLSAITHGTREQ